MDPYIKKLKNLSTFGYTVIILSAVVLLFNRVLASPFNWILVGLAITGLLIGMIVIGNSNTDKYKYLKKFGIQIQAKALYISLQANQTLQGPMRPGGMVSPFRPAYLANFKIICEGIDPTNQSKKIYASDNLTSHPDVKITASTSFRVYVDKDDSSVYWVDLSDITFDNNLPNVLFSGLKATVNYRSYDGVNYQKV